MGDLQPIDERGGGHDIVVGVHHSHLTLQVTGVLLEVFAGFHLDGKEVVAVPSELGRLLVVDNSLYHFKVPERLTRE